MICRRQNTASRKRKRVLAIHSITDYSAERHVKRSEDLQTMVCFESYIFVGLRSNMSIIIEVCMQNQSTLTPLPIMPPKIPTLCVQHINLISGNTHGAYCYDKEEKKELADHSCSVKKVSNNVHRIIPAVVASNYRCFFCDHD